MCIFSNRSYVSSSEDCNCYKGFAGPGSPSFCALRWLSGISVLHSDFHIFLQCLARWGILPFDVKKMELHPWCESKDVQECTTIKWTISFLPSTSTERVTYPAGRTILPSKATKGLLYSVKSSGVSPIPSYRPGYIIFAPLP